MYGPNDWNTVNDNDINIFSQGKDQIQTPEEFQKEIESLSNKYEAKAPDMWTKEEKH